MMTSKLEVNHILQGDCRERLRELPEACIDTFITDPPYGLGFMGAEWDVFEPKRLVDRSSRKARKTSVPPPGHGRINSNGAIEYDYSRGGLIGYQSWCETWARECLRVAKPGGFLLCFGGPRTVHRLACGIEDAGWILRDQLIWLHAQGFPKPCDISKQIDKRLGAKRSRSRQAVGSTGGGNFRGGRGDASRVVTEVQSDDAVTDTAAAWKGWHTQLKPAWEPIIVAMKPLDGTFANNAISHGVAGFWIDGTRLPILDQDYQRNCPGDRGQSKNDNRVLQYQLTPGHANEKGRWPPNVILDEEAASLLDRQAPPQRSGGTPKSRRADKTRNVYGSFTGEENPAGIGVTAGPVSRFFYCAKVTPQERGTGNDHPTVKPVAVMEWLCRLTKTPIGGIVLDPFAGSGTTAIACERTGRPWVLIEREQHYVDVATRRIHGPLFAASANHQSSIIDDRSKPVPAAGEANS